MEEANGRLSDMEAEKARLMTLMKSLEDEAKRHAAAMAALNDRIARHLTHI